MFRPMISALATAILMASSAAADVLRTDFKGVSYVPGPEEASRITSMNRMKLLSAGLDGGFDANSPPLTPGRTDRVEIPEGFEAKLKEALETELLDAPSARFRELSIIAERGHIRLAICGEINAKNAYGAYAGYEPFIALMVNPYAVPSAEGAIFMGKAWTQTECRSL